MFERIVQRSIDGKYAIKRWSVFRWTYQDVSDPQYWWTNPNKVNEYCWTDDLDLINRLFNNKETVIRKK
jgi:hypothetical protein